MKRVVMTVRLTVDIEEDVDPESLCVDVLEDALTVITTGGDEVDSELVEYKTTDVFECEEED